MTPYACHSKPRKDGYWAQHLWPSFDKRDLPEREYVWVDDVMTKECQYRKSTPDPRCEGCTCP